MPFTDRAGHQIHYQVRGPAEAPPLLLIMGLALSSRAWDTLPERLAKNFRVITFDNRGTGRSSRGGWAFRMRDLADDAAAVLDAAGVSGTNLFGISMGGMIAQEFALRHPERVLRLALGATFAGWLRSHKPGLCTQLDLLLMNLGRNSEKRVSRVLVSPGWQAKNPHSAVDWIRRAEATTLRFALAQMAAIGRHTTARRLSRIAAPTLVITGDADKLVPARNSQELARLIPNARLVLLRGAGHAFPLEREDETVRALEQHFLG